ncbi:LamG-like jellyroll fold domain-containing protein [Fluviicola sp.]|uniref:LamG-like jellyroll fold domain-containing protein n=1 Tax=Fluviicola sp. TaxID=1917219 RepID=UPI0031DED1DC
MKHTILLLALICPALFSSAQSQQNSLSFDGTNDYVSCALPGIFTNLANNDFTFEAWVKIESTSPGRVFFAQQDNSNFATLLLSNGMLFYVKISNITYTSSVALPPQNQWVHLAATWDASEQLPIIYMNGVRQYGTSGGASSSAVNSTMTIGSRTDGAQLFTGEMDEVRIWNTARKECEIRSTMHSIPAGNEVNLIHYYNFNRGTAGGNNPTFTLLPDLAGINSGTLMNFALNGNTSNWVSSTAPLTGIGPQNAYETTDTAAICEGESYSFGTQNLTATGVYQETFTSAEGCDSLVTLQLNVRTVNMPPVIQASCASYFWPQTGQTYFTSGIYRDTLTSSYGCDSILTLDLTIGQHSAASVQMDACGSYTWSLTGETYTASGLYYDTIPNASGCDSVITLDLTILEPTTSTWPVTSCSSYEWPQNGETYTASGLYYDTISNAAGCDSIITLDLTILEPTTAIIYASSCGPYYWSQTGLTYSFSGSYQDTIPNAAGCDSVVTLSLLINQLPQGVITDNGQGTLSVTTIAEVSDWIDCSTGQAIPGQQGQSTFTPVQNGSYAAILENTMTLCKDTTACYTIGSVGLEEHAFSDLHITPNPAHDQVTVLFQGETAHLTVLDAQGKQVLTQTVSSGAQISLLTLEQGIYLFRLENSYGTAIQRVVKE